MNDGWDYQLSNYKNTHYYIMDIDHYESDERGIGSIPNWIQLVLYPIYIIISHYIL